jgi:hypothetical protein
MLISDGSWVSEACKAISKVATDQADLERRLALLTADKMLGFYKPLVKPAVPLTVMKYRELNKEQRYKFNKDNPDWSENPVINEFLAAESGADCNNQSNVWWLTNCQKYDIGELRKDKIQATLNLYDVDLRRHSTPRKHADPQVEFVRNTFGGIVGENAE